MNDGDFLVDILDKDGNVVDNKLRKDIVKGQDIYHAVYCVVITPENNIVLNLIANREDMPNLHAGSYGCSAATIKRTGESGDEAMTRALKNELNIIENPVLISEKVLAVDNTWRKVGIYSVVSEMPTDYNQEDIQELVKVSPDEFKKILNETPEKITPILGLFWKYHKN